MGKSYLKTGYCGIHRRFARNFDKFPLRRTAARERKRQRREVAAFVGRKLNALVRETAREPETLLIGFPCKVSPEGTPQEEAWPGMADWQETAAAIRDAAGLANSRILVCNDAELAAWSALASPLTAAWNRFAVITAGTALGLALVCREGWPPAAGPNDLREAISR